MEALARLEREDPKLAFQVARIVGVSAVVGVMRVEAYGGGEAGEREPGGEKGSPRFV